MFPESFINRVKKGKENPYLNAKLFYENRYLEIFCMSILGEGKDMVIQVCTENGTFNFDNFFELNKRLFFLRRK